MRKITLFFALLFFTTLSFGQTPMSGTFKVGTGEVAPNFETLSAAVTALNTNGVGGDVILEITSDITEAANIGLGVNTNGFSILIRPSADEDRTVTFTLNSDNKGPSGHFVIGYVDVTLSWTDANVVATNNVTIDGYAEGGKTRRLKFTNSNLTVNGSKMIVVVGGNENTTIKNCIVENKSTGTSALGIGTVTRKGTGIEVGPKGVLIENNEIYSLISLSGQGINTTNSGTLTDQKTKGLVVKDNIIKAQGRCGWFYHIDSGKFSGNELYLTQNGAPGTVNYGLWFGTGSTGTFDIVDNRIILVTTKENAATGSFGTRALSLAGGNTYNIFNNTFAGMDRLSVAAANVNQCYIFVGGIANIYNNSFYLPALTASETPGYYNALQMYDGTKAKVLNNIFVSNDDSKTVLISKPSSVSDYNTFYLKAGNTNAKIVDSYSTLAEYQTATGFDLNSNYVDVNFTDAAAGDLSLAGTSIGDYNLAAPGLAEVSVDILGAARNSSLVYKGAYEVSNLNSVAKAFSVTVPQGTENVYIAGSFTGKEWDITNPFKLNKTATANVFSGIFPCTDDVQYKYLNHTENWDYQEAKDLGSEAWYPDAQVKPTSGDNRSYNATDVVNYWVAQPKVTLNAKMAEGSVIPTVLYVKGSWDNWAEQIKFTPADPGSFTATIGNGTTDLIYSNMEYKYYTTDTTIPNWEANADGTDRSNRWSIYPVMADEIALFVTQITTGLETTSVEVQILRTATGIQVNFEGEATIELYNINGVMLDKTKTVNSYSRDLQSGAYILRVNGVASKFVR